MSTLRIGLDNPVFAGRVVLPHSRTYRSRPTPRIAPRIITDVVAVQPKVQTFITPPITQPAPIIPVQAIKGNEARSNFYGSLHQPKQIQTEKPLLLRLRQGIFVMMAGILFTVGIAVAFQAQKANEAVTTQAAVLSQHSEVAIPNVGGVSSNETIPDETKPDPKTAVENYQVAPDLPRILTIDNVKVRARVFRVGVDAAGIMKTPANIFDAGWYEGSAKPGDAGGAVLINGHVAGIKGPGLFANLKKLKAGDEIKLERGDGKLFTYSVRETRRYDKDSVDMASAMVSVETGKPGLNIITCDGKFNPRENTYEDRLIVFAVQE